MSCSYDDDTISLCLGSVDLFADLPEELRAELAGSLETVRLSRGDVLLEEGTAANALYFVVSGRFKVTTKGRASPLAELGVGQLIGEIAFLAGGGRTATATAIRDSVVLRLSRAAFDKLSTQSPRIWQTLTITLAKRLADRNRLSAAHRHPRPRTITLIPAGPQAMPEDFIKRFIELISNNNRTRVLTAANYEVLGVKPGEGPSDRVLGDDALSALNALETDYEFVVYIAESALTEWSKLAIRQADLVMSVAMHANGAERPQQPIPLNDHERFAQTVHDFIDQRLVLLHAKRAPIEGTVHWLSNRNVQMHHHLCIADDQDYARLLRFINGTAIGFVACGGGALCAAHVGIFQALTEAGATFDIMGGTSGGAAMTGAFAMGEKPEMIERQTQDMFVTGGAMRRYTLPLYSLLDQTHFDSHLRKCYGDTRMIEDLWIPYFAVATNLSNGELHCQRSGLLWEAIRASGSVPALLPPFFTPEGDMLVDGGLVDNVPIGVMRDLKTGPNVVVAFHVPEHKPFAVNYSDLPSRGELLRRLATSRDRKRLGEVPLIGAVLARALMAHSHDFMPSLSDDDILLVPPLPPEIGLLDWHLHGELKADAYEWAKQECMRLEEDGDPAWQKIAMRVQTVAWKSA